MATIDECRAAVHGLIAALDAVDPEVRARHVPARRIACRVTDLDLLFVGRLDEDGCHDVEENPTDPGTVDVRLTLDSSELVALADGTDDFLHAWLRGRVQISASVRDLLRLRSLFGL